jgi:hypothetical protein
LAAPSLSRSVEIHLFRVREIKCDVVRYKARRVRCRSPPSCNSSSRRQHIPHPRANPAAVPRADSVSPTTAAHAHVWPPSPPTSRPPARLRLPSSCTSVPHGESLLPVPHPPLPCGVRPHLRQLQLPAGARSPSPAAQAACLRPPDSTRQATARGPSPHSLLSSPGRRPFQSDVRLTAICCRFHRR